MGNENDLLKAYRVLNTEGQNLVLSIANTALIAQKATLKQLLKTHPDLKIELEPVQLESLKLAVNHG